MRLIVGYNAPTKATLKRILIVNKLTGDCYDAEYEITNKSSTPDDIKNHKHTHYDISISALVNEDGESIDAEYFDATELVKDIDVIELIVDDLKLIDPDYNAMSRTKSWDIPVSYAVFATNIITKNVVFSEDLRC